MVGVGLWGSYAAGGFARLKKVLWEALCHRKGLAVIARGGVWERKPYDRFFFSCENSFYTSHLVFSCLSGFSVKDVK